jgi:hypothetical protein
MNDQSVLKVLTSALVIAVGARLYTVRSGTDNAQWLSGKHSGPCRQQTAPIREFVRWPSATHLSITCRSGA